MQSKNSNGALLIHLLMMKKKLANAIPAGVCFRELYVFTYKEKEEDMQNNMLVTPIISVLYDFSKKQIFLPIL